ncbi:alkaline phosphatase family protein [Jejudonia soesokkakensis]|uniref:Alkaline phosphatase family protein n=1 Tax=Jejudonia soesokkakensis TaxID=1323432 RepID=A0ABW2MPH0_9FLAO
MNKNKTILIGWDAADWKVIGPLIAKGHMPSLKKLINEGVYGNMSTMNPPYSPMLWSSVATGKTPDKHGILGFVEVTPNQKALRPVTANSRKSRAIWNILHNQGCKSNLVGWWPTFPAEPINGVVVTDKFQKVKTDPKKESPIVKGTIHPEDFVQKLGNFRMFPWEVTKEHILPFIPNAAKIDQTAKTNHLISFAKILSQNVSIQNATTYLIRETEWDFMGVYFDLIDHLCHAFMKYHPPKMKNISEDQYDMYKDVVNGAYRFQDMMLGRVMEMIDDDTTIIVMSDHGFESGDKRIFKMPKVAAAPALDHRQFGIFVARGPNIKKNEKIFGMNLIDVAPTILHHYGLPIGKDMDGKVILDIFKETHTPKMIESWDSIDGDFAELSDEKEVDPLSDEETMEQLIELGYIEKPDEKKETAILKTKCELKHNLARVYLGKKDYENAKVLLLELTQEEDPIDLGPYYVDLVKTLLKMDNFDEAEKYMKKFKSIKTEVKFNTHFLESDILLGQGKIVKALKVLLDIPQNNRFSPELSYKIGNIHYINREFDKAKKCFEASIEALQDNPKYHKSLAQTFYMLGNYEESAEHALIAIDLVKYFPSAHYILGQALEKLGDIENAKLAYETAARLTPKKYHIAEKAVENVIEKMELDFDLINKSNFKYRENQIVIVSGLPRSGTSLMMQMLDKGGLKTLIDGKREADESNPKGYYEYEPVMTIHKDNSWLDKAQNKVVKIVAPLLRHIKKQYRYKIIFMKRDLHEVIQSQRKMTGKDTDILPVKLYNAYVDQLKKVEAWKEREPGVELIYVDYVDMINNPKPVVDTIESFIGKDLEKDLMASCIDKSLHRNKVNN